ncbi:MAG: hypothetical protein WCJ24_03040 [Candidatus Saccharibacteria bacterium]
MTETSNSTPNENILFFLPGVAEGVTFRNYDTTYANQQASPVIDACARLGLNAGFVDIFETHLRELNLVIRENQFDQKGEDGLSNRSYLGVQKISQNSLAVRVATGQDAVHEWKRVLVVSEKDACEKIEFLEAVFKKTELPPDGSDNIRGVVLDWIFAEQAMSALGNSIYMNNVLGGYHVDVDGQSDYIKAHLSISRSYSKVRGLESDFRIDKDFKNLKEGFGLLMLHESLLGRGVFISAAKADRILEMIRLIFPDAYRSNVIANHFNSVELVEERLRSYQDLSDSVELIVQEADDN